MNPIHLQHFAYEELTGGRLRPHQAEGIALMASTPKTVCADPTGAGKTVQAAGVLAHAVEAGEVTLDRSGLVLTMGDQLAHQTATELSRFLPGLTVLNLVGHRGLDSYASEETRRQTLAEPAHVKVMTYSQWQVRSHLWDGPLPVVILDEVSELKGGGERYAAVLSATAMAARVHLFTATLYENHPLEVWTLYSLLHLPHLPNRRAFEDEYVKWQVFDNGSRPVAWRDAKAAERLRHLTAAHYFRREHALADLDLPAYSREDVWVPLSPAQARGMRQADRYNGLARQQHQKKVVTGKLSGPSGRAVFTAQHVNRLVIGDPTVKVLVIADSLTELDTIAGDLEGLGIGHVHLRGETSKGRRQDVVEGFRSDPGISVLLGSKVVERGLNMQFVRHLVSVGLPDNPARLQQQVGRIVRHGSPFCEVQHWLILSDCEYDRGAAARVLRKEQEAALLIA